MAENIGHIGQRVSYYVKRFPCQVHTLKLFWKNQGQYGIFAWIVLNRKTIHRNLTGSMGFQGKGLSGRKALEPRIFSVQGAFNTIFGPRDFQVKGTFGRFSI